MRNLQLNSLVLVITNVATGALGLLFWAVAARVDSAESIGRASVLITAATMLATMANLSFGPMFERFLTGFGSRAGRFVRFGFGCSAVSAAGLGALLVLVGPRQELFHSTIEMMLFPCVVCVFAWFALQDQTASALGVARWAGYKNISHSLVKLGALAALTGATSIVIVGSWTIPSLACAAALGVFLWRRLRSSALSKAPVELPPRRELLAYFGSSYGIQVVGNIAPLTIPLVVLSALGSELTAYFAITWALITAIFNFGTILVGPFIAQVSSHPEELHHLIRRFGLMIGALTIGSSLFLAIGGPVVLGLIGSNYREHGASLLYFAAIIMPFWLIITLYDAVARVERRLTLAVVTQGLLTVLTVGGTAFLTPFLGVKGVGIAYLLAAVLCGVIVAGPLLRGFRRLARRADAGFGELPL